MSRHRIVIDRWEGLREEGLVREPVRMVIAGEEAKHAIRIKRLEAGGFVDLLDGNGGVGLARVVETRKSRRGEWELVLELTEFRQAAPHSPRVEVLSAVPKGERLEAMIDGLSQVGAASWAPLAAERSVTDPRPGKLERLARVAKEATKQCGRAWALELGGAVGFREAIGPGVVLADASGGSYNAAGLPSVRILVGPEGGWTPEELALAREAGTRIVRFGPHAMRIETAAVVAAAIVIEHESRPAGL